MSSSVEPSATSAVASLTDLSLSDERLNNLRQKAEEAAENDFLWALGVRAPSPNQARKVCEILGVACEDEKRVKAVAVLRCHYPNILQGIRDVASSEEEEMAEPVKVVWGPQHHSNLLHRKDSGFWEKVLSPLGVRLGRDVHPPLLNAIATFEVIGYSPTWHFRIETPYGTIVVKPVVNIEDHQTLRSFFIPPISSSLGKRTYYWADAAIFVYRDRRALGLAKKIAAAYERETRRRRRPAKAVVIKEY